MNPVRARVASRGLKHFQNKWKVWAASGMLALSIAPVPAHAQAMGKVELDPAPVAADSSDKGTAQAAPAAGKPATEHVAVAGHPDATATMMHAGEATGMMTPGGLSMPALPLNLGLGGSSAAAAYAAPMNFAPINTPPETAPADPAVPAEPSTSPPVTKAETKAPGAPTRAIEHMAIQPKAAPAASEPAAAGPAATGSTGGSLWSGLGSLGQVGAAMAIVIGLILVGKALAGKFVPGARATNGRGVIEILARHPLAKNQSIVLVRIGSQIVALNQGKESSESVLVISDATEVAKIIGQIEGQSPTSMQAGFNKLLANARMDLEQGDEAESEQEPELRSLTPESLDEQLEEMAAAKRQLMELRQHVRSVRDSLPRA